MWIRSQDKTVLKECDCFSIGTHESKPVIYGVKGEWMINANDGITPFRLGKYETLERAIQVLDSIQKEIVDLTGISYRKTDTDSGLTKTEYSEAVFQMPEK